MITSSEINFVRDVLYDLKTLADPSEYLEEDVDEAFRILESLASHDAGLVSDVINEIDRLKEESTPESLN